MLERMVGGGTTTEKSEKINAKHTKRDRSAHGVRNDSDAILHRRPACAQTSEGRMSERSCASGLNGCVQTVGTSDQENARNEQRFLVVSIGCALPQSVPTV